jgi:hypothetical protein
MLSGWLAPLVQLGRNYRLARFGEVKLLRSCIERNKPHSTSSDFSCQYADSGFTRAEQISLTEILTASSKDSEKSYSYDSSLKRFEAVALEPTTGTGEAGLPSLALCLSSIHSHDCIP